MESITKHITHEQYLALKDLTPVERYHYADNLDNKIINICIKDGYGFYGCGEPYEKGGEYFVTLTIGNTCD